MRGGDRVAMVVAQWRFFAVQTCIKANDLLSLAVN